MIAAARGDADQQRRIATEYCLSAKGPDALANILAMQTAMIWARIVEANTRSIGDAAFLAHILARAAIIFEDIGCEMAGSGYRAEVLGLLDRVADLPGGDEADCGLLAVAPACSPFELEQAKAERAYYDA